MKVASGPVLGLAAVVASPALHQAYTGGLPVDLALTRYLVAVLIVWAALSTLAVMVGTTPTPSREDAPAGAVSAGDEPAESDPLV